MVGLLYHPPRVAVNSTLLMTTYWCKRNHTILRHNRGIGSDGLGSFSQGSGNKELVL